MTALASKWVNLREYIAHISWRVWIGIALSAAFLECLIELAQPDSLAYYDGSIVYPWFSAMKVVVQILLAIIGILSFFGPLTGSDPPSNWPTLLIVFLTVCACLFSCYFEFGAEFGNSSIYTQKSVLYQGNVYHLAEMTDGSDPYGDWETYSSYVVYKCDGIGFLCHEYFLPSYDGGIYVGEVGIADARPDFVIDDSDGRLYLQIGSEKYLVHYNLNGPEPD